MTEDHSVGGGWEAFVWLGLFKQQQKAVNEVDSGRDQEEDSSTDQRRK
jgi:hypothetical protein